MKYCLGIDPGTNGGTTIIAEDGSIALTLVHSKLTRHDYVEAIYPYKKQIKYSIIEKVSAFPGQGVSSMFKFGGAYNDARRTCECFRIPYELKTPQQWQKFLGVKKKQKEESKPQFKNRLKAKAQELYPKDKINKEEADSILIAYAAWKSKVNPAAI